MATLTIQGLRKVFPNGVVAVDGVDLEVADGEFLVLVGPSGCGKSTLLRMVAGLEATTAGQVLLDEQAIGDLTPSERDVAMVFQNYALYPHMTVAENLGYALRVARTDKSEAATRVAATAELLGIADLLDRRPGELSGGQQQRVAMGRAIVRQPKLFLMDEPLSNLDAALRVQMRAEIAALQRRLGVTTVYVTHDQVEAMTMGDRVAVLDHGRLLQVASPQELYDDPVDLAVASFLGSPAMNLLRGTVRGNAIVVGDHTLTLPPATRKRFPTLRERDGADVAVGIRPEHLGAAATATKENVLAAEATMVESLGSDLLVHVSVAADGVTSAGPTKVVARFAPDARPDLGPVRLVVDVRRIHLFDRDSGATLRG